MIQDAFAMKKIRQYEASQHKAEVGKSKVRKALAFADENDEKELNDVLRELSRYAWGGIYIQTPSLSPVIVSEEYYDDVYSDGGELSIDRGMYLYLDFMDKDNEEKIETFEPSVEKALRQIEEVRALLKRYEDIVSKYR